MLQCCVVVLPEAVIAELCQSSSEAGPQAGIVEVPVHKSP